MYLSRPTITDENEQAILQCLLSLLQSVGDFRREHVCCSKGKGRAVKANKKTEIEALPAWMPDVYDHLTVGFNSTVRRLESLARNRKPQILSVSTNIGQQDTPVANLAVVFVCREALPNIMTSSLPLLVATSAPVSARAKLVQMSAESEAKIAQALHQPRVGVLGIESGTAGAESLVRYIQDNVSVMDVSWLDQPPAPMYLSVEVDTVVSVAKNKSDAQSRKRKSPGG